MKSSVSAKRCPECGKVTGLHTPTCAGCGHLFRTRFAEPVERTEAFDAVMLPRPPTATFAATPRRRGLSTFTLAFLGAFCLVTTVGLGVWLAWSVSREMSGAERASVSPAASSAPPSSYIDTDSRGRAEKLYEQIGIAMSLYDVDQVAGGQGRVARSSNPHVLLLSYDFPDQSVRVSLYRSDITGVDYRVQAVALYHGNTLLHRHTDDN